MVTIGQGGRADRREIERLIAEYHASEGLTPIKERIIWAVDQQLRGQSLGLLLVPRDKDTILGVTLAVYTPSAELGRVMTVNDFFVRPAFEDGADRPLENAAAPRRASDEDLCPRRNLGIRLHPIKPLRNISSAFKSAAPAAPRMVL